MEQRVIHILAASFGERDQVYRITGKVGSYEKNRSVIPWD
jgi:hypothetical protein